MVFGMEHERILRGFGVAGLVIGSLLAIFGGLAGEAGRLAAGYAFLITASAGYLLIGLAVRGVMRRRRTRATQLGA
jgi:hypothetical protein